MPVRVFDRHDRRSKGPPCAKLVSGSLLSIPLQSDDSANLSYLHCPQIGRVRASPFVTNRKRYVASKWRAVKDLRNTAVVRSPCRPKLAEPCRGSTRCLACWTRSVVDQAEPKWRNWQTRRIQNPVPAREWGFDSPLRQFSDLFFSDRKKKRPAPRGDRPWVLVDRGLIATGVVAGCD